MVTASWAMGAVALACFTCSLQVGHVRAGRRVLAGRERRAVRRGLLLGCLVCVQAAEEVPLREQCRVVKPGGWLSTGTGHLFVTDWLVCLERGGAPVDQGIATSPSILNRSSVESVCHGYRAVRGDGRRGRVRPGSSG